MADYEYKIGATLGTMLYVEDIISVVPTGEFVRWPVVYTRGDGQTEGDGLPSCAWHFDIISQVDLNTLRAYVTSGATYLKSDTIFIKTRSDDGTFLTLTGIMHWPEDTEEDRVMGGYYRKLKIEFTNLEVAS